MAVNVRNVRDLLMRFGMTLNSTRGLSRGALGRFFLTREFSRCFRKHKREFQQVSDMLADDFSRETYWAVIEARKTENYQSISQFNISPQYFLKDILPPVDNEVFIDGGGYDGKDTAAFFRDYCGGGQARSYLWEPDASNRGKIAETLRGYANYEIKPFALWSRREELSFFASGSSNSRVSGYGRVTVQADSIDNQHKGERITFIKMDIEGAEIDALKGAERIIREQRPKLAICIYHESRHLYEIPLLIKAMVPEYRIYVRHHSNSRSETVAYAIV